MEWIGIAILLYIGWMIAPFVIMLVLSIISLPFVIIGKLFEK